jgi:hypothetical protein
MVTIAARMAPSSRSLRRSHRGRGATASTSRVAATPATIRRVPNVEISTKPARNVPAMLPNAAAA